MYSSSVDIRPEWVVKEQIPFTSLSKLNYQVGAPEELAFCGTLRYYDKLYDRITPRLEKPLKRVPRPRRTGTTSDDPIIRSTRPFPTLSSLSHQQQVKALLQTVCCMFSSSGMAAPSGRSSPALWALLRLM